MKIMSPHRRGGDKFFFGVDPIDVTVTLFCVMVSHEQVGGF